MLRVNLFLSGDQTQPKQWFETLRDCYSFMKPALKKPGEIKHRIIEVKKLIYGLGTTQQRSQNLELAYEEIRDIFEDMHISVYIAGWYLPLIKERDEFEEFAKESNR